MSYLVKVSGHYYFRVRIPIDLLKVFKRREVKRALRTKDLKHARTLVKVWGFKTEKLFLLLRSGMLTDEQIEKAVQRFLRDTLRDFERGRAAAAPAQTTEDSLKKLERAYEIMEEEDRKSLTYNRLQDIEEWLDNEIASQGLSVQKNTKEYRILGRAILKARIDF
jgi:hypothetical protein